MKPKTKLLFICTGNRDRSPTAEDLFRDSKDYEARSAGTHPFAVQKVTQELIDWADKIFVMSELEDRHLTFETNFNLRGKAVIDLDIPDHYERGSQRLVNLITARLSRHLPRNAENFVLAPPPTTKSSGL